MSISVSVSTPIGLTARRRGVNSQRGPRLGGGRSARRLRSAQGDRTRDIRKGARRDLYSLWEVFVWGFGVVFLSCACVSVSGVLFSVGACVCVCVCVCVTSFSYYIYLSIHLSIHRCI